MVPLTIDVCKDQEPLWQVSVRRNEAGQRFGEYCQVSLTREPV